MHRNKGIIFKVTLDSSFIGALKTCLRFTVLKKNILIKYVNIFVYNHLVGQDSVKCGKQGKQENIRTKFWPQGMTIP